MNYDLIIFDCDGTLVDSERLGIKVLLECLKDLQIQFDEDFAIRTFKGRKMSATLELIEQLSSSKLPDNFEETTRELMAQRFERELMPIDGVHKLIERITTQTCVASNGPMEKMMISLRVTGLLPYFLDRVFSGYQCKSWKPEPGLFYFAAESMGVKPEKCAVVEDSEHGVCAGITAGMDVFALTTPDEFSYYRNLGATPFDKMDQLYALLEH